MSDLSNYLPLSRGGTEDESSVTGDWGAESAASLSLVIELLASLSHEEWESDSLCAGWSVRQVAGHLVWRLGTAHRVMIVDVARAVLTGRLRPSRITDRFARRAAEADYGQLVARLRDIAASYPRSRRHTSVIELTEIVVHGYDIARPLGRRLDFSPATTGAVALARAAIPMIEVRALVKAHTMVATDAGWRVGRGRTFSGTAETLILMLFGRPKAP